MFGRFWRFAMNKVYTLLPLSAPLQLHLAKKLSLYLSRFTVNNLVLFIVAWARVSYTRDLIRRPLDYSLFVALLFPFYSAVVLGTLVGLINFYPVYVPYFVLVFYLGAGFIAHRTLHFLVSDVYRQALGSLVYLRNWAAELVTSPLTLIWLNFSGWLSSLINNLSRFFSQNELLLQDGFIIDFLQKQTLELWLRQYVLSTGSVFSERLVFETITKFFFKYLLWPTKTRVYFEAASVSDLLLITFYSLLTILLLSISLFLLF